MEYALELKTLGCVAGAMFLGALVGVEREFADKPVGMHMLVAGAAALLVTLGEILVTHFGDRFASGLIRADPIRIVEAIVTGVAFLGAGTIIRHGEGAILQGLTAAAALLFTAALGICVAQTILALVTLRMLRIIEIKLNQNSN